MGFLSKKTLICEKCGKEFQARLARKLCDECQIKEFDLEQELADYLSYSNLYMDRKIEKNEYEIIIEHRNAILEKNRNDRGITIDELKSIAANYNTLTDEEARNAIARARDSEVSDTLGALYTPGFIMPELYKGTVVSTEDVFAVAYHEDNNYLSGTAEILSCVVFTNDPYIAAFSMVFSGKLDGGFFSFKSNSLRTGIETLFTEMCPNLTYPVQELKNLKKQIKTEKSVKGNIDYKKMMKFIEWSEVFLAPFESKKYEGRFSYETIELLNRYGYITHKKVDELLELNKSKQSAFWYDKDPTKQ